MAFAPVEQQIPRYYSVRIATKKWPLDWGNSMPFEPGYETLSIISLPLVQKKSRFLSLFTAGTILVKTPDEINSIA
ncbi:hypothetical protein BCON_0181g00220 [Botryotinia convoluta]|uniref:Uncharacterized protein n=1 Tax=Botryotinia convoluta TaxID=54673 RepID=A0A4Z1HP15_9HELO|nr:hypothetical protein BCON_0181g00220 [Botryotinia convoluta]